MYIFIYLYMCIFVYLYIFPLEFIWRSLHVQSGTVNELRKLMNGSTDLALGYNYSPGI